MTVPSTMTIKKLGRNKTLFPWSLNNVGSIVRYSSETIRYCFLLKPWEKIFICFFLWIRELSCWVWLDTCQETCQVQLSNSNSVGVSVDGRYCQLQACFLKSVEGKVQGVVLSEGRHSCMVENSWGVCSVLCVIKPHNGKKRNTLPC